MTTKMQDRVTDLQDVVDNVNIMLEREYQRGFHVGYEKALSDLKAALGGVLGGNSVIAPAAARTANGGATETNGLGPVSTRAVMYVIQYPGSTRSEIMKHAAVRGEGVLDKLCASGFIRKEVMPVEQRKTGESYVRYHPA